MSSSEIFSADADRVLNPGTENEMLGNADALKQINDEGDGVGGTLLFGRSQTTKVKDSNSVLREQSEVVSTMGIVNQWLLIGLMLVVFLLIASAGLIFYLSYRLRHSQAYSLSTAG